MSKTFTTCFLIALTSLVTSMTVSAKIDPNRVDSLLITQALNEVDAGHDTNAYDLLKTVTPTSPYYRLALLQIQKITYKNAEWDKFFGNANYYRRELLTQFVEPQVLLLEILALIKHCQFNTANKLLQFSQSLTDSLMTFNPKSSDSKIKDIYAKELQRHEGNRIELRKDLEIFDKHLTAMSDLLFLQSKLPKDVNTVPTTTPFEVFNPTQYWSIPTQFQEKIMDRAVNNPSGLRVYVENLCSKARS